MDNEAKLRAMKWDLYQKSTYFKRLFQTEDGKKVLEILENEFDRERVYVPNSDETEYNLGRRDVVIYIRQMLRYEDERRESDTGTNGLESEPPGGFAVQRSV